MTKPDFIDDQGIRLLEAVENPQRFLDPQAFRAARLHKEDQANDQPKDPDAEHWKPVPNWKALFGDEGISRLCLITDGGVGKSTALRWAERELNSNGTLALKADLGELPNTPRQYLAVLLKLLRRAPGNQSLKKEGERLLRRLLDRGRLVLLVDAIEQSRAVRGTRQNPKVTALAEFLKIDGQNCRAIVAGRPHAVDRYWDDLFDGESWRFAQLDHFTPKQQERYLGTERYRRLERLGVEVLAIPRALDVIRRLESERLQGLETASAVYWECVQQMLRHAVKQDVALEAKFEMGDALRLLGVLAFEMVREGNFYGVPKGEFEAFRDRVWDRHPGELPAKGRFRRELNVLGKLNEILDHGFLEGQGLHQVFWRNQTLQEFFAALWLTRFARAGTAEPESEHAWMAERLPLAWKTETEEYYWIWRFAAEMPADGRAEASWTGMMNCCFRPGDGTAAETRRSTELVYRSWDTLAAYAKRKGSEAARLRDEFLGEFGGIILAGERGKEPARLGKKLIAGIVEVPGGTFQMGSSEEEEDSFGDEMPRHKVRVNTFWMGQYAVTNEEYELFDPSHRERRWLEEVREDGEEGGSRWIESAGHRQGKEERCPVVLVSWYDAWVFCQWLGHGCRLPTEAEREYSCRAGTETAFHFGRSLSLAQANFNGQRNWREKPKGKPLARTCEVGSYAANDFKLFDMHGNVWEWCADWYDTKYDASSPEENPQGPLTGQSRVLRGGSWNYYARSCRAAYRV